MIQVVCMMPAFFIILFLRSDSFEVPNARKARIDSFHNPNKDVSENFKELKSVFSSIMTNKV